MRAAAQEAGIQGRRGAEQVHQQPAVTTEIADQGDITRRLVVAVAEGFAFVGVQQGPQRFRQGEVVVNAGNALHGLAVAQGQALAVHVLQAADIGVAVAGDRNHLFLGQRAGHRRAPQVLVAELAVGETVDALQLFQRLRRVGARGGDELQQRLGIVGGDLRVGQGRAQRLRVRGQGQLAVAVNAQAFAFDAVQALAEQRQVGALAEQGQATGQKRAQSRIPLRG